MPHRSNSLHSRTGDVEHVQAIIEFALGRRTTRTRTIEQMGSSRHYGSENPSDNASFSDEAGEKRSEPSGRCGVDVYIVSTSPFRQPAQPETDRSHEIDVARANGAL